MTPTTRIRVRVVGKEHVAADVAAFEFEPLAGELPAWEPGAHIEVDSGFGAPRQYSLCGPVASPTWKIAVLRVEDGRGGSRWLHDNLAVGDVVEIGSPRNNFELRDAAEYLFMAGGIGITPLIPMVEAVRAAGRRWRLVYGGRTRESMAFREVLGANPEVDFVPQDSKGLIDVGAELGAVVPGRRIYCCGPEPLLAAVEAAVADRVGEHLHTERFKATIPSGDDEAFDVELASSGKRVHVAAGQSIIDALQGVGVDVEFSCREGTCGTCETGVGTSCSATRRRPSTTA
jgi:ferredoxin-NADP reductase